jgi:hypothetical protein
MHINVVTVPCGYAHSAATSLILLILDCLAVLITCYSWLLAPFV